MQEKVNIFDEVVGSISDKDAEKYLSVSPIDGHLAKEWYLK